MFLGIAYLFVGGLDLIHSLAYKGMGVFDGFDANLPTQLWIAARYMESISLFIAPVFLGRRMTYGIVMLGYGMVFLGVVLSIFYLRVFPDCFVEGSGLTAFKRNSEYIIMLILSGALYTLFRKRGEFDKEVFSMLVASILFTVGAELAFTFYVSVYGLSNLLGHFLKIASFFLIYKALIETGLKKPYDLLFRSMQQSLRRLEHLSKTDGLTDLFNRRALLEALKNEIDRVRRYRSELSLILCDIDFFKEVNDMYGHSVGDEALQFIAGIIKQTSREPDIVGRYGGDEFMLILPETPVSRAQGFSKRMLTVLENSEFQMPDGKKVAFSLSIGITSFHPGDDADSLIKRADIALFTSKQAGRKKVSLFDL